GRDDDPEGLLLRLDRTENRAVGVHERAELAIYIGIVTEVIGDIDLARLENHAGDRGAVDRDPELPGALLGQVRARPCGLEADGVRVIQVEPDALGAGEGGDRLARSGEDL